MKDDAGAVPEDFWNSVEARVTECRYQFAGMGNMAWGFSTRKKFRIAFEYRVAGVGYAGAYQSDKAVAQGERVRCGITRCGRRRTTGTCM